MNPDSNTTEWIGSALRAYQHHALSADGGRSQQRYIGKRLLIRSKCEQKDLPKQFSKLLAGRAEKRTARRFEASAIVNRMLGFGLLSAQR